MLYRVLIFLGTIAFANLFAQKVEISIHTSPFSISSDDQNEWVTDITGINYDSSKKIITVRGNKGKKRILSALEILSILSTSMSTDSAPACIIDHSNEERDAILKFEDQFVRRPHNSDGTLCALEWERTKFPQIIMIQNIERNSTLAHILFQTDLTIKKMIFNKKPLYAFGVNSFVTYAESRIFEKLKKNEPVGDGFESIFYLSPDSLTYMLEDKSLTFQKITFKLESTGQLDVKNIYKNENVRKIETDYANCFTKAMNKIIEHNTVLQRFREAFKVYFYCISYKDKISHEGQIHSMTSVTTGTPVKETMNAFKFSTILEVPDLISEQSRYSGLILRRAFGQKSNAYINQKVHIRWFLLSGAVTFNTTKSVLLIK